MAKKDKKKTEPATIDEVLKQLNFKSDLGLYQGKDIHRREKISTGSLALDELLEGGYVQGKLIECYGKESTGKSTLAYAFLSQITEMKGFIDGESAYDAENAEMLGVDTSTLIVQKPAYIEQGMDMVLRMIDAGIKAIVFDSIAGIPPKEELEKDIEDHTVGKKASKMGQLMRQLHLKADEAGATVFFINQVRDSMSMFGSPFTTPGGHALKFHASYRIWITGKPAIKAGKDVIGHNMSIRLTKNKFGKPDLKTEVPLIYGYGIASEWEIMQQAFDEGVLIKKGSWINDDAGESICQGEASLFGLLLDNPDYLEELKRKLVDKKTNQNV